MKKTKWFLIFSPMKKISILFIGEKVISQRSEKMTINKRVFDVAKTRVKVCGGILTQTLNILFASVMAIMPVMACAESRAEMSSKEIARAIIESQSDLPELAEVAAGDEFSGWVSNYYLIDSAQVMGGAIFCAEGAEVSEIAVLTLSDARHGAAVQKLLENYITSRTELFGYYAPAQAAIAKKGVALVKGNCAALLLCKDTAAAKKAFLSCFGKSAQSSQKNKNVETEPAKKSSESNVASRPAPAEGYDGDAILRAYKSGDDSALSAKNRQILRAAERAISQNITDGMTVYQKERAIHDYITAWSKFDWAVLGHGDVSENSRTPYGVLIERNAMCHGFSLCFQLFMDMLGIECVTVYSTSSGSTPHSWNVVKIEGDWYCVDTAWDSTSGHAYFNVTSRHLKSKGYRWDETSAPEATGTKYAYRG